MADSKYSRAALQGVVTPADGSAPFLDFLNAAYSRLYKNLVFAYQYRVSPAEEFNLAKVSFNLYGTTDLWYLLASYNGMINPLKELVSGTVLNVPTLDSIEEYFRAARAQIGEQVVLS